MFKRFRKRKPGIHIFLLLMFKVSNAFQSFMVYEKEEFRNRIFANISSTVSDIISPTECAVTCWDEELCFNFLFSANTNVCLLYHSTLIDVPFYQTEIGWNLYITENACTMHDGYVYSKPLMFCYKYYPALGRNYAQAVSVCGSDGGYLVKVDSQQRQDEMEKYLKSFTDGSVRIQGRLQSNVQWEFDDGTALTFFNWNTEGGQPEGRSGEDFIALKNEYQGKWSDIHSHAVYAFVCEIPM